MKSELPVSVAFVAESTSSISSRLSRHFSIFRAKSFISLSLILSSVISFEFVFVNDVKKECSFFF